MTVSLERYADRNGTRAEITQNKHCASFQLSVYEVYDGCFARVLYKNTYHTKDAARRAMRRRLTAPITKEEK